MFAGNWAPVGWEFCDGALYPISENETLFTLIGTRYGGDGETTFAVPNLSGRVPMHMASVPTMGEMAGVESVTLTTNQMPVHNHALLASEGVADTVTVSGNVPAEAAKRFYVSPGTTTAMSPSAILPTGGSQPHENMQPFTVVTFIISFYGLYPQPT
ncbi:MAG TPA: tail fiber protein [Acidimicrobiales bacterium]|nr:tail fiber protein [Acidimicrobiales bacterium]